MWCGVVGGGGGGGGVVMMTLVFDRRPLCIYRVASNFAPPQVSRTRGLSLHMYNSLATSQLMDTEWTTDFFDQNLSLVESVESCLCRSRECALNVKSLDPHDLSRNV